MQANALLLPEEILFAGIECAPLVKVTDVLSRMAQRLFQWLPIPSIAGTSMTVFERRASQTELGLTGRSRSAKPQAWKIVTEQR